MPRYRTPYHLIIERTQTIIDYDRGISPILEQLDHYCGAVYSSNFEFPGRYTAWDIGFIHPPLVITARARHFCIQAKNERGKQLLAYIAPHFEPLASRMPSLKNLVISETTITGDIEQNEQFFAEEQRSQQPSIFTILRHIHTLFAHQAYPAHSNSTQSTSTIAKDASLMDHHLGLYGAFGYDLAFQFEAIAQRLIRKPSQRDLVLYFPDELYVVDHRKNVAHIYRYEFEWKNQSTTGLPRCDDTSTPASSNAGDTSPLSADEKSTKRSMPPGAYANIVKQAKDYFKRGDLFEVVPSQSFYETISTSPSIIFQRLRQHNPAPYGFWINLGEQEHMIGASPEMFVRVTGRQVETRPISGTIKRGITPIEDAINIQHLLNSSKDEAELTMCTDVDRNDKSRVCEPGSVTVTGRKEIEMYSKLIHTVDHVIGTLRSEFDAYDAFLTHTWAVTVTGAPKQWAMQFIEDHETTPRCWYGGAVGYATFDGNMNTGLSIRMIQLRGKIAEVRAGATLLFYSDADAEEQETELKASAMLQAITTAPASKNTLNLNVDLPGKNKQIVLLDHQDSFVHTLANYFRQTGATVTTLRVSHVTMEHLQSIQPDLIVLSPGPGCPADFKMGKTIEQLLALQVPIFGVCLGLQGLVEYYGGRLHTLSIPMHGKPSRVNILEEKPLFTHVPSSITVGRYHSLYAKRDELPAPLIATAIVEVDQSHDIVMALRHRDLPIAAVQFHPESILTLQQNIGMQIINNVVATLP